MSNNRMEVDSDEEIANESGTSQAGRLSSAGKMFSIYLKNFTTHSELIVYPGQQLNILIGPNGTGKSAIVAAIILGMGGSTKILSEHNKLSDYVKNGKDRASIRLVLFRDNNGTKSEFRRDFGRDNKSVFTIDGAKITEKQYLKAVHDLNIQVGNLCQFLPQERVQDFAKQDAQQLFMSTQKSVCSEEIIEYYEKLKDMRTVHLSGGKRLQNIEDALLDNERRVELLQGIVGDIQRRDVLAEKKGNIEKKLAWMNYEEAAAKHKAMSDDLKLAKKSLEESTQKRNALDHQVREVDNGRKQYEAQFLDVNTKSKNCQRDLDRTIEEIESAEYKISRAEAELRDVENSAAEYTANINENKLVLMVFEKERSDYLLQIQSVEHIEEQMSDTDRVVDEQRQKIEHLIEERAKVNTQLNSLIIPEIKNIEYKIHQMESVEAAKLKRLRELSEDAYKAVMWLRNNTSKFAHKIHEPLMLVMSSRSDEYVPYIENVVSFRDFLAFVCENIDDMNDFLTIVREELKLEVNAVHSAATNEVHFKPQTPIADMRQLGGEIYLLDCIEAPAPVVNYLCQANKIHNVLLGGENLSSNTAHLPPQIHTFFTPMCKYTVKTSKYSNQKITMSVGIESKQLLNVEINAKVLNELKQKREQRVRESDGIRNKRSKIELSIQASEQVCKEKFREKNDLQKKIHIYEEHKKKAERQREKLQRLSLETVDVDDAKGKFSETVKQALEKNQENIAKIISLYDNYGKCCVEARIAKARLDVFKANTRNLDVEIMNCTEEIDRRKSYCSRISDLLDQQKRQCKEKQTAAKKMTDNTQPSDGDKFTHTKQFSELPDDKNALLEEMEEIDAQIGVRSDNDQRTIDEYNEKRTIIEKLREDLAAANTNSGTVEHQMNEMHRKWFPKVQQMVDSINVTFGNFMSSMNCAGEIELICPTEHDYAQYGIEIRVKYRHNSDLCKLDRFVQSGGERAVAIAVYSLSLQHLSQVPFRCVDEINQGMDRSNERRIFQMLVNNVAKLGQSQFFYVTPKLQTNLPYNKYVTCLTILNGSTRDKSMSF